MRNIFKQLITLGRGCNLPKDPYEAKSSGATIISLKEPYKNSVGGIWQCLLCFLAFAVIVLLGGGGHFLVKEHPLAEASDTAPRIIRGSDVASGNHRFYVAISTKKVSSGRSVLCGGQLLGAGF